MFEKRSRKHGRRDAPPRNLRQDASRREHARDTTYPRRVYLALSSSPSACCRRHSARPPRERNSSLCGLINDHWIFQRRRNHFHLLVAVISRDCASSPLSVVRRIFSDTNELFTPVIVSNVNVSFRFLPRLILLRNNKCTFHIRNCMWIIHFTNFILLGKIENAHAFSCAFHYSRHL